MSFSRFCLLLAKAVIAAGLITLPPAASPIGGDGPSPGDDARTVPSVAAAGPDGQGWFGGTVVL